MSSSPLAILVIDLAFGDSGKGTVIDYLARRHRPHAVVRFNGGPQAAHNVVTPEGRHHTFSQFGSGTFVAGTRTFLSHFMLIEPYALFNEAAQLESLGVADVWGRLLIDGRCPVITPPQQAANRLRELARGGAAHGTCGVGVGETVSDLLETPELVPTARELSDRPTILRKLRALCDRKIDQLRDIIPPLQSHARARFSLDTLLRPVWIETALDNYAELARRAAVLDERAARALLREPGTLLFEGAQGVLLDEWFGFHPHTTWSTTTFANADKLLDEAGYGGGRTRLGVLRTYFTRHGPGPFVTEFAPPAPALPEPHNDGRGWQGRFRTGLFDAVAARYALDVTGPVGGSALTHLDRLPALGYRLCRAYRDRDTDDHLAEDAFIRQGGRITSLRVHRPANLTRQERMTALLKRCEPDETFPAGNDAAAFIASVEAELGTPVVLNSSGPTAADKRELAPLGRLALNPPASPPRRPS